MWNPLFEQVIAWVGLALLLLLCLPITGIQKLVLDLCAWALRLALLRCDRCRCLPVVSSWGFACRGEEHAQHSPGPERYPARAGGASLRYLRGHTDSNSDPATARDPGRHPQASWLATLPLTCFGGRAKGCADSACVRAATGPHRAPDGSQGRRGHFGERWIA